MFLTCFLTCYPVFILICLRLSLSTVHNLFLPSCHAVTPSIPNSLVHHKHFLFYNVREKVLVPENMSKASVLPVPNHFRYARAFLGTYQHLFICLLLLSFFVQLIFSIPTGHPFQMLPTVLHRPTSINVQVSCIQCYIPNFIFASFAHRSIFPSTIFSCLWTMSCPL